MARHCSSALTITSFCSSSSGSVNSLFQSGIHLHHFILVNLFSKQYGKTSATDQGIPYSTEPEDKVQVAYERGTVAQVYDKIEADLIEGLKYVSDQYYSVLRYHFNTTAANAFAARFYLFKRDYVKAEQYATAALGASPAEKMRKDYWSTSFTSLNSDATTFYSSSSSSNFLLIPTNSIAFISMCNNYYAAGARYACNRGAATSTIYGYGPCWDTNFLPTMAQHLYVNSKQEYGMWPSWMYMLFEYTDKVAGIGYPKRIRAEFTGEETLLTRAEARIFMGKIDEAVSAQLEGLGQIPEIQEIFIDHIRFGLKHRMLDIMTKKAAYAAGKDTE